MSPNTHSKDTQALVISLFHDIWRGVRFAPQNGVCNGLCKGKVDPHVCRVSHHEVQMKNALIDVKFLIRHASAKHKAVMLVPFNWSV